MTSLFPAYFRWSKPCENVNICGSFDNWGKCIKLNKTSDAFGRGSLFDITLNLPIGVHTYKFEVDGEWKYDPESAFTSDEYGNITNFIEIVAKDGEPQIPTKSILRDDNFEFPTMNPDATVAAQRIQEEYDLDMIIEPNPTIIEGFIPTDPSKLPQRRYSRHDRDSALLAARTEHFGGDLVTQEHQSRELSGGHQSLIASESTTSNNHLGKLIIFLVGLPGRGKTFMGHILCRHLTWMGHESKLFNVGEYRQLTIGSETPPEFWNPANEEGYDKRIEISKNCLNNALNALDSDEYSCVVFDATNCTVERRELLRQTVNERGKYSIMFIESILNDPAIVQSTIFDMKFNSKDYRNKNLEEAGKDYHNRIQHYISIYETLSELENINFIKVIDMGRQIFCNQIYGFLQSKILFLLANFHLRPHPIWLSRHGESMYNTLGKIGGDSALSSSGDKYAEQLHRFINAHYPEKTELSIWTSTMLRTGMTVRRFIEGGRSVIKWKQLDEIDAGICDGMTYKEVVEKMPEEYKARKEQKLHYRYPRGESYQDVIHRLEPVITELMRQTKPILIVAHQAILRVLYGYLTNKRPDECPVIDIPLHNLIQLTPKAYKCEEVWHSPL